MLEIPPIGYKALIVQLGSSAADRQSSISELRELVHSADAEIVGEVTGRLDRPHPAHFVGTGKLEEIAEMRQLLNADWVVINHTLSGIQERNLEKYLGCRVSDRVGLILDIFARRARSAEGKVQVELAQMQHLSTRLVKGWTHLERQKGGIGNRGGPGEKQIELDRRMIETRITRLKKQLALLEKQRATQSQARKRRRVPTIALVGYTNAGKSTLFNTLTRSEVYAADQLFATLDTTARQWTLSTGISVVLSDTVGFIRDLPHSLVDSFKATLREATHADILLHVIDSAHEQSEEQIASVQSVLSQIEAENLPQIRIYNKIDRSDTLSAHIEYTPERLPSAVYVSALTGAGIRDGLLTQAITEQLRGQGWTWEIPHWNSLATASYEEESET